MNNALLSVFDKLLSNEAAQLLGNEVFPKAAGRVLATLPVPSEVEQELHSVPCELNRDERYAFYNFMKYVWSGRRSVLEIGCFLGGSSRAMAMGMYDNACRDPQAKYQVYDKFVSYYDKASLLEKLAPLFASGVLSEQMRTEIEQGEEYPDFKEIFTRIHSSLPYYPLLSVHQAELPDLPEHLPQIGTKLFRVEPDSEFEVVFVDGCKSWYGTKYFMGEVAGHTHPGAYYLFQDYAWYSCFWVPAFVSLFAECFELVAFCRTTYIFRQKAALTPEMITTRFPDSPEQLGANALDTLFQKVIANAQRAGDLFGLIQGSIQRASALAYCGNVERAKTLIADLSKLPWGNQFARYIQDASVSPTYRPGAHSSDPTIRVNLA